MNRRFLAVGLVTLLVMVSSHHRVAAQAPGNYIVVLHDNEVDVPGVATLHARAYGVGLRHVYQRAMKGYAATIPAVRLADLQRDPQVAFISEDRPVEAVSQILPTGVDRIDAEWSSHFASNTWNAAVAVIDTGSGPHKELNIVGGVNCSTGRSYKDGNGHGTHVAGSIGATNNADGVVGVAPGIPIYSVRVLNNFGSGSWSSVACGIDWVTARRAEFNDGAADGDPGANIIVANLSLGGDGADDGNCGNTNNDALHKAICGSVAVGVTYVVAAGNSNVNFAASVPAAYDEVLTVTAVADFNGQPGGGAAPTCRLDVDDTAADFSNFTTAGSADESHTIAAPGVCIQSTWKGGGYNTISGTSMAAPHVTGTAALCIVSGACPSSAPALVLDRLRTNAAAQGALYGFVGDPQNPIGTRYYGYLVSADEY